MKRMQLAGKTALITGAASGIGRALALALAARGTHLALVDRNEEGLAETSALIDASVTRSTHVADMGSAASIADLPERVLAVHSGIDLLINNAGVALGGSFENTSQADFEWLIDINFLGVVRMTRAFLPVLHRSDDARVVNVSSIFGIIAPPGQTAYSASKFAVRGFSMALAAELHGSNVGVSVVHPGGVATSIARNARVPSNVSQDDIERTQRRWAKMLRLAPERAAQIVIDGIERRKVRILIGNDARQAALAERLFPVGYQRIVRGRT